MTRGRAGWAVAAAGLVVSAAGLLVWLTLGAADEDLPVATGDAGASAAASAVDAKPLRRATAGSATGASIEIDDTPIPEGAKGTIRGTVRDDAGSPVVGAFVSADVWRRTDRDEWNGEFFAETGDDGAYAIADLNPSVVWYVVADAGGHVRARPAEAVVMTANRLEVTCDLVVPRCGSIEATVLDTGGEPLPRSVRVLPLDGDVAGAHDWTEVPPGRWRVFVDSPGRSGDSRVVEVTAGEQTRVEFRLGDEAEITGTVLDSDGRPVKWIDVVAVVADGSLDPLDVTARAAADGTFRLRGLRRTQYRLGFSNPDVASDGPPTVLAPATGVTLTIRDESKVTFHLVYPPGFPAADRSADVAVVVFESWGSRKLTTRWDGDQGTVRIPGGEEVDLAITPLHCATWHGRVRARAGEVLDIGDVRPDLARDIEGSVVDAAGEPINGATVRYDAGRLSRLCVTDGRGTLLIDRIPPTDCVLTVEAPGFVAKRVDCRADDAAPLTVKLARGGLLWVRAESKDGAPPAGAAVRIDDASGTAWWAAPPALDDRGECAVRLAPGRWRITVAGCAPVDADVREGATTSVRVRRP